MIRTAVLRAVEGFDMPMALVERIGGFVTLPVQFRPALGRQRLPLSRSDADC